MHMPYGLIIFRGLPLKNTRSHMKLYALTLGNPQRNRLTDTDPVKFCCTLLGLSCSGFYAWRKRPAKLISAQELTLYSVARERFRKSRESLGSRELMKVLRKKGFNVGRAKTHSIMPQLNLAVMQRVAYRVSTKR